MKKSYDFSQGVKNPYLKRIIVSVKIENVRDIGKSLRCDAVVDTDASLMLLPAELLPGTKSNRSRAIVTKEFPHVGMKPTLPPPRRKPKVDGKNE